MDEQPSAGAPPVVAVVVTRDPGPWFEDALAALGAQDYPNLSVLVVDAGGDPGLTARVASVLPGAFVRRATGTFGFGSAANEVLEVVEGASHFLFCHDDVAPEADAVRILVEEAFRSNAGVVTPKLVEWERPDRLLTVGLAVDKLAAPSGLAEPGELDQEQHDAVRDVFAGPSACLLVRADLFSTLGGFDVAMAGRGDDVDLCWRAQLAGARVLVAPGARVRHRAATQHGERGVPAGPAGEDPQVVGARSRLRTVLKNYSRVHLVRVLPQAVLVGLLELVLALVTGNGRRARAVIGAWTWNLGRLADIRKARRRTQRQRSMNDSELRRLQVRGSARLANFIRSALADEDHGISVASVSRGIAGSLREGSLREPIAVWTAIVIVFGVGSRHLGTIPAVGQLAPFPSAGELFDSFATGWRTPGLGASGPAPFAFALLGLGGAVLLGSTALLRELLVLGAYPVAAIGAYRLGRVFGGSRRVRLAAVVVYLAIPVSYNAMARGRWGGLLMFAAAPFLVRRVAAAAGVAPFAPATTRGTDTSNGTFFERIGPTILRHGVPLGILTAVLGAFVPLALVVVPLIGLAVLAGSIVAGQAGAAARAFVTSVAAALGGAILLFPWTLELFGPGAGWAAFSGVRGAATDALDLAAVLRFHTGPVGGTVMGWAFLVAAALPLVIGREWRLAWATRLWAVALACWGLAWLTSRGSIGMPVGAVEVLLAPAAVAIAGCVALGVVAFEVDLPAYAFGWPQVASIVAAVAVAIGVLPVLSAAGNGRWGLPPQDFSRLLSWMPAQREAGDFRVLWIGDAGNLPLSGWPLGEGLAYGTSRGGMPDARELWPGSSDGATHLLADVVAVARRGETTHLGRLLAPTGVRYLALPTRPAPRGGPRVELPADLIQALRSQLDLKEIESDPSITVYENVAWAPMRVALGPPASTNAVTAQSLSAATGIDLTGGQPVLPAGKSQTSFSGTLDGGDDVLVAEASAPEWELRSGGHKVRRTKAFGWANAYPAAPAGRAKLHYRTPITRWVALVLELLFWLLAIRALIVVRRSRRAESRTPPEERPPDPAVVAPVVAGLAAVAKGAK